MEWSNGGRSEEEVDRMISEMINRTKGRFLTQGVSFNKTCPRQLDLLKKALMASKSFSGLGKELLAIRFDESGAGRGIVMPQMMRNEPKPQNVGNFL